MNQFTFSLFLSVSDKFTRFCQWKNVELNIHVSSSRSTWKCHIVAFTGLFNVDLYLLPKQTMMCKHDGMWSVWKSDYNWRKWYCMYQFSCFYCKNENIIVDKFTLCSNGFPKPEIPPIPILYIPTLHLNCYFLNIQEFKHVLPIFPTADHEWFQRPSDHWQGRLWGGVWLQEGWHRKDVRKPEHFAHKLDLKHKKCSHLFSFFPMSLYVRYAMKCLDKKRIKMKQGETLALNERIMLSLVSTGVSFHYIVCLFCIIILSFTMLYVFNLSASF